MSFPAFKPCISLDSFAACPKLPYIQGRGCGIILRFHRVLAWHLGQRCKWSYGWDQHAETILAWLAWIFIGLPKGGKALLGHPKYSLNNVVACECSDYRAPYNSGLVQVLRYHDMWGSHDQEYLKPLLSQSQRWYEPMRMHKEWSHGYLHLLGSTCHLGSPSHEDMHHERHPHLRHFPPIHWGCSKSACWYSAARTFCETLFAVW